MAKSMLASSRAKKAESTSKLRLDIQGLRAVAVGVVLLYHAGMPWLPGGFVGVDVFFVISGYLITGGLVSELRRKGGISLRGFYARRIGRILPAASLAIVSTLVLAWVLLPETRWRQIGWDGFASAFSYVNWVFSGNAVNYLAQEQAESPFQHYWSLSVEEQFYMVWPLLLMIVGALSRKLNFKLQRGMLVALALVAVPSFAWSVYLTATNPGAAYFVTTTRGWELAAGCALAIMANRSERKVSAPVAATVGWLGLVAIFAAAALYTKATPFPSFYAALPVLGAVAVIWAGAHVGTTGPAFLLNRKPMVALGNISYSVYLWHWPLLIIAAGVLGKLDPLMGLLVIAASLVPAWLSYVAVERPIQNLLKESMSKVDAFQWGVILIAGAAAASLILTVMVPPTPPASTVKYTPAKGAQTTKTAPLVPVAAIGAETLLNSKNPPKVTDSFPEIAPAPVQAANDLHAANQNGCMQEVGSSEPRPCEFGDTAGERTIAVVGDSHAAMLLPGYEAVANERGWKIISYTKGACPWINVGINHEDTPFTQCREWVKGVSAALMKNKPDLIIAGMTRYRTNDGAVDDADTSYTKLVDGMRETWAPFLKLGIPVVSVRDTPQPGTNIPDCVAKNMNSLSKCAVNKNDVLHPAPPEVEATKDLAGTTVLDMTSSFCFGEDCPAVIGGTLVYRDTNHLTATYAGSLHGQIDKVLAPLVK